jgi:hypothetical protein
MYLDPKIFNQFVKHSALGNFKLFYLLNEELEEEKRECVVETHHRSETFVLQENQNIVNYH